MPPLLADRRARPQRLLRRLGRLFGLRAALRLARGPDPGNDGRDEWQRPEREPQGTISKPQREVKTMKTWLCAAILIGLAVPLMPSPASAQQGEQAEALVITAENLMADDERHQAIADGGGDRNTLLPGDVILYRLVFTNIH